MADGVWKGVQSQVIGHFKQLSLNKFFDPSTPSMRKGRDGEWKKWGKKMENNGENSSPLTLLPVDRLTATDCNADRSCQNSGPLTSLPVDRLTATDCNAAARANIWFFGSQCDIYE